MSSLVHQLQSGALDSKVTVVDLLRKGLVVASKLGLPEFEKWVNGELNGYPDGKSVPAYRRVNVELQARNPLKGWIPVLLTDPADAQAFGQHAFTNPISELEHLASREGTIRMPLEDAWQLRIAQHTGWDFPTSQRVSTSSVVAIIDKVRHTLLQWALQLEKDGAVGEGLSFSAEEKDAVVAAGHHYNTVNNFYGSVDRSQIAQHSPGATQIVNQQLDVDAVRRFVEAARKEAGGLGLAPIQVQEFEVDLTTLEAQASSPNPKKSILQETGESLGRILEAAAGGAAGNLLAQLASLHLF